MNTLYLDMFQSWGAENLLHFTKELTGLAEFGISFQIWICVSGNSSCSQRQHLCSWMDSRCSWGFLRMNMCRACMIPVPGPVAPSPIVWSPTPWPRIFHFHGIYSILDAKLHISMVFAPVWMENLIFPWYVQHFGCKTSYVHTNMPTYLYRYIPTYLHTYMHTYLRT